MFSRVGTEKKYARIAVNVAHVQGVFDYHVPEDLKPILELGQLVTIPFGKQKVQGIIIEFPEFPAVPRTKAVQDILDPVPVVTTPSDYAGPDDQ